MAVKRSAAVLVALLAVLAPLVGVVAVAPTAAAPSGMVTIGDGQIGSDLPPNTPMGEVASRLQDQGVLTSAHGDTLEVTVTNPGRAKKYTDGSVLGGGPIAIVFTDDQHDAGRQVAVPKSVLQDVLGYVPDAAYGTHDSGETWTRQTRVEDEYVIIDVPHFSSNTVTFAGEYSLSATPAADGAQFQYDIADLDAADKFSIDVTGSVNSHTETVSAGNVGDGGTVSADIAGNVDPPSTTLTFTGNGFRREDTASKTAVSNGGSMTVDVDGNYEPLGPGGSGEPEVTFTGDGFRRDDSASATSVSDGATMSPDVDGNYDPLGPGGTGDPEVTFTANGFGTQWDNYDATGASLSSSQSISVDGNLAPTNGAGSNPELEVTANAPNTAYAPMDEVSGTASDQEFVGDRDSNGASSLSLVTKMVPDASGTVTELRVYVNDAVGSDPGTTVDVKIDTGSLDSTLNEGTTIKSGWDPSWSTGWQTIPLDSTYEVTGGNSYELAFISSNGDGDGTNDFLQLDQEYTDGDNWVSSYRDGSENYKQSRHVNAEWTIEQSVENLDVSDGSGTSVSFGTMSDGETVTKNIDLSTSSTTLDWSGSGGGSIDYTLTMQEREGADSPSIDVDGDNTDEWSHSGIVLGGDSVTETTTGLSPGDNSWTVSTTTGSVDVSASWYERKGTEDPAIDIDGDGSDEFVHTGTLWDGDTATVTTSELSSGDNSWSVSTTKGNVDIDAAWYERKGAEDPGIDIDGDGTDEASHTGILWGGDTADVSIDPTVSDDTWTVSVLKGEVDVSADITEKTGTFDPAVEVNGNTTGYTGTVSDGTTQSLSTDPSWLKSGTNRVNITVGDGTLSADAPTPQVDLAYSHGLQDNVSTVYTAEQWTDRYNVSKTYSSERTAANLTIPFESNVWAIPNIETRINGSSWSSVSGGNYQIDGNDVDVDLDGIYGGSIPAMTQIEVRADGRKVNPADLTLTVVEGTDTGSKLDTKIKVESTGADPRLGVGPTQNGDRLHYLYNATWDESVYAVVEGNSQTVHLPNAQAGETARVTYLPTEVTTNGGDVKLTVEKTGSEPVLDVEPGPQGEDADTVTITHYDTVSGQKYALYSETNEIVRDSGTASSPVILSDDDSDETLSIFAESGGSSDGSSDDGGGGLPVGQFTTESGGPNWPLIFAVLLGGLGLLAVVQYRTGRNPLSTAASGATEAGSMLAARPRALAVLLVLGFGAAVFFGVIEVPASVLVILVIAGIALVSYVGLQRSGNFSLPVFGLIVGVSAFGALVATGQLAAIFDTLGTSGSAIAILGLLFVGYKAIQRITQKRQISFNLRSE